MGAIYDSRHQLKKAKRLAGEQQKRAKLERDPFDDGSLKGEEARSLLEEAERIAPWSDYVVSVTDWLEDYGFITSNQAAALNKIVSHGDGSEGR